MYKQNSYNLYPKQMSSTLSKYSTKCTKMHDKIVTKMWGYFCKDFLTRAYPRQARSRELSSIRALGISKVNNRFVSNKEGKIY